MSGMNWDRLERERRNARVRQEQPIGEHDIPFPARLLPSLRQAAGKSAAKALRVSSSTYLMSQCPHCPSPVRADRLQAHIRRTHPGFSAEVRAAAPVRPPHEFTIECSAAEAAKINSICRRLDTRPVDLLSHVVCTWLAEQRA